jgi:hypothetical protein
VHKPLAICIEDLEAPSGGRYLRCVAVAGRRPGLGLDGAGAVVWRSKDGLACQLCVSADGRLVLFRPEGGAEVGVHRAGRSLDVPVEKPVILIDKDEVTVGERRLRVHVHGEAPRVAPPAPLVPERGRGAGLAQVAAAAAVIGVVAATGGCDGEPPWRVAATPTIEVIDQPPEPEIPPDLGLVVQGGGWWVIHAPEDGGKMETHGYLTVYRGEYTFESVDGGPVGPPLEGALAFLEEEPTGSVEIVFAEGVTPRDALDAHAPGDLLAHCTFSAGDEVLAELTIVVEDGGSLSMRDEAGDMIASNVPLW